MLGIILSIWSYQLPHPEGTGRDITKLKSHLASDLNTVENSLSNYPTLSDEDEQSLDKSSWYINILKGDSLVYWNQVDRPVLPFDAKSFKGIYKEINEEYILLLSPNIYDEDRKVRSNVLTELNLNNRLRLPKTISIDNIESIDYLESTSIRLNRYTGLFRYLIFLLSFIIAVHSISSYCRQIHGIAKSLVVHTSISFGFLLVMQLY